MGKFHQLSPELWLLIDVILCCYFVAGYQACLQRFYCRMEWVFYVVFRNLFVSFLCKL